MSQFNDHIDSFEQFLRETTESFCMTPSRKVWTSIYNNIHPRRIWPSFSTNMLLLFCLLFFHVPKKNKVIEIHDANKTLTHVNQHEKNPLLSSLEKKRNDSKASGSKIKHSLPIIPIHLPNQSNKLTECLNTFTSNTTSPVVSDEYEIATTSFSEYKALAIQDRKKGVVTNQYHTSASTLRSNKSQSYLFQVYASPGFGYSQPFEKDHRENNGVGNTLSTTGNSSGVGNNNLRTTLNLEAGGAVLMNVSRIVRLKAGMQINYTHFDENSPDANISNNNVSNGTSIALTNNSLFEKDNNRVENAELYQVSLPIGSEIEILGNDRFKWYAGATVQPSYLMNAESQNEMALTSRDALFGLRKWNLNTSIETYMSYKMKNGVVLNIGPQFRYQWLSTYNQPLMSGMDRLYNIGLKLGISGNF